MCSPDVLADLHGILDRLVEVPPAALADGEAVVALHRALARMEAIATRAAAAFDRSGGWQADGARTPAAWLAAECSLPEGTARRRVQVGRALPHLPVAEAGLLRGDIGSSAVELLSRARTERTAGRLAADEARHTSTRASARPLFSVHVDHATLGRVCELARSRTVVAPGALVPWLAEADVERVVFAGPDRVLGVGAARRCFTGADRRAVEVRDRECCSASCGVPAEDCEVDHVVPFAEGGPTVADNGRLACGFYNRSRPGARRPDRHEEEEERGPP